MTILLCVIFFLSGAAGVLFETLWFRVTGLTLGSSFWASNIVLASFMAGLAAGNAIAARYGARLRRPLELYAGIEAIVGVAGVAIVMGLPVVSPGLGRIFTHLLTGAWQINLVRIVVAFSLMFVPATAMGLTLPLLVKAMTRHDASFGRSLGLLYGWNTSGGVVGALYGELWLVRSLGQHGAAFIAAGLNLAAAAMALFLSRQAGPITESVPVASRSKSSRRRSRSLLAAAFLSGAILLALEVVWFRFLQLFVFGTSYIFAAMLAVVLFGIAAGGLMAANWLGSDERAHRFAPLIALGAGIATEVTYAFFRPAAGGPLYTTTNTSAALLLFVRLMLPTSLLSGVLFTLLGAAQREQAKEEAEAVGSLTFANTLGAMCGSLIAGFVLLPMLGMEKAIFVLVLSYGLTAGLIMLVPAVKPWPRFSRLVVAVSLMLFGAAAAFYPLGLMRRSLIPLVIDRYKSAKPEIVALREGLTETIIYLRVFFHRHPLYHRLMTNGHSMSATTYRGRRYMKMYVYWGMAINPNARRALLIGYGVGTTAKALTDTRQLTSIDVVDISREVLESGAIPFIGTLPPLVDPRVHVHVEDGRFFLQTTDKRFDLITGEPPPLRAAGVTNLYSREYFRLLHDRLREGGVVTYWLPVNQLWVTETKSIVQGFCEAFPDCSLWSGAGLQWMLAGTRGAHSNVPEEQFAAQWRDPAVAPELAALAFETPESLGTTFLADAKTLGEWTRGIAPLDDDHPGRILMSDPPEGHEDAAYRSFMDPRSVRKRFAASAFISGLWPTALRQRTLDSFEQQAALEGAFFWGLANPMQVLHSVLTQSSLRTLPLIMMETEPDIQRIAVPLYEAGEHDSTLEFEMGARAISARDYEAAVHHLGLVTGSSQTAKARLVRTLALGIMGKRAEARQSLDSIDAHSLTPSEARSTVWLKQWLRLAPPEADPNQ